MSDWTVDGIDYLQQQWFWLRQNDGQAPLQLSLDQFGPPTKAEFLSGSTNQYNVAYDTLRGLIIDVIYTLTGGAFGSGQADLQEDITITNHSQNRIEFSFFQYSDFNLDPNGNDAVTLTNTGNLNRAVQTGGGTTLTETVFNPTAIGNNSTFFGEPNQSPITKNNLNTVPGLFLGFLFPSPVGPVVGDVTWAYQWEGGVEPGETFTINKSKSLSASASPPNPNPIPEPSTLLLFGTGLFLLAGLARKTYRR